MKATTLSAAMGEAWRPAAARRGAICSGMLHWAAFSTNSSDHTSRNNATLGINKVHMVKMFKSGRILKIQRMYLYLVCKLKLGEARDVPGPLHGGKEQLGRELADGVDGGDVVLQLGVPGNGGVCRGGFTLLHTSHQILVFTWQQGKAPP